MSRLAPAPAALLVALLATCVVVALEFGQGERGGALVVYGVIVFALVSIVMTLYMNRRRP